MAETQNGLDKRVALGGILILLGGLFLLNSLNVLDFHIGRVIFSWPFVMLVIGLFILINTSKKVNRWIINRAGYFLSDSQNLSAN